MEKYFITYKHINNDIDDISHIEIISAKDTTEAIALIEKKHDHEIEWLSLNNADDPFLKKERSKDEWQLCPKCNGDGNLLRFNSPSITSDEPICDLCYGRKVINIDTGLPPIYKTDKL